MAVLNSTIVRGNLRVTDEIVGPLNITNLSAGTNGQFLSVSNNVPTWVDRPDVNIDEALALTAGSNISFSTTSSSVTISANYSIATNSTAGIIKPWYSTTGSSTYNSGSTAPSVGSDSPNISARTTTAGRYYAVEMDANGRAYVNVPWSAGTSTTHSLYRYDFMVSGRTGGGEPDTIVTFSLFSTTAYAESTWTYANLVSRLSNQGYNSQTKICTASGMKVSSYYAPQGSAHVLGVYSNGSNLYCVYAETATSGGTLSINTCNFGSYGTPTVSVVVNGPFTV